MFCANMPKISLDMPNELLDDLKLHVGDEHKFVSVADAIRTACRKMLDQLTRWISAMVYKGNGMVSESKPNKLFRPS